MQIKDLLSAPIHGDAFSDRALMDQIHEFVANESNSMDDRRRALFKLDEVMGEATELPSEEDVYEYLSWCK